MGRDGEGERVSIGAQRRRCSVLESVLGVRLSSREGPSADTSETTGERKGRKVRHRDEAGLADVAHCFFPPLLVLAFSEQEMSVTDLQSASFSSTSQRKNGKQVDR